EEPDGLLRPRRHRRELPDRRRPSGDAVGAGLNPLARPDDGRPAAPGGAGRGQAGRVGAPAAHVFKVFFGKSIVLAHVPLGALPFAPWTPPRWAGGKAAAASG